MKKTWKRKQGEKKYEKLKKILSKSKGKLFYNKNIN